MVISNFGISQTGANLKLSSHFSLQLQRKLKKTEVKPIENASKANDSDFDHSNFCTRKGADLKRKCTETASM